MKYLLDTNVLSEIRKSNCSPEVKIFIGKIPMEDISISVISIGEIVFGIEKLPDGKKRVELSSWVYTEIPKQFENRIIFVDTGVIVEWGKLCARAGRTLPYNDSLIAATALAHGLTLLTRNIRDFAAVEGLSLSNPWN
ncbi:ribonuclease VapC [Spirochaetia bacterium]|nr:ribonuclease VapC [Spirochaetia bacterium]